MKNRFLLVAFFLVAIDATAAECKPDSQTGRSADCNPPASATIVKTPAHNDASMAPQKSAGGHESWPDPSGSDRTTDENETDEVTGEACVLKSANGVCIDAGDD
jgi:hypothetical protein